MNIMEKWDETRGPWHPGTTEQKPHRFGWYEVKIKGTFEDEVIVERFFGVGGWRFSENCEFPCTNQNLPWRGLAAEPK